MKSISMTADKIRENIDEARHLIEYAYSIHDVDRGLADWYKQMAQAHMSFNNMGHEVITRLIKEAEASPKYKELSPGMMAVYNDQHAKMIRETSEVLTMIEMYGK